MITLKFAKKFSQLMLICCLTYLTSCNITKNYKVGALVPSKIIETLSHSYCPDTMKLVNLDLRNIRETAFFDKVAPNTAPIYVATAGGPGACKTTILENYLQDKQNFVYVDPDIRTLKYMINTYHQSITNYELSKHTGVDVQKNAYKKWRDASNYIANTILNEAFAGGYNIAHGTTSTSKAIGDLYKKLKQKNYKIVLLLCYAEDQAREAAIEYRAQAQFFVQTSAADVFEKGKLFPERFPIYFTYADEVHFYWTDDFLKGSTHAATYRRLGGFTTHNQEALSKFAKKYEEDRVFLPDLPPFDAFIKLAC